MLQMCRVNVNVRLFCAAVDMCKCNENAIVIMLELSQSIDAINFSRNATEIKTSFFPSAEEVTHHLQAPQRM